MSSRYYKIISLSSKHFELSEEKNIATKTSSKNEIIRLANNISLDATLFDTTLDYSLETVQLEQICKKKEYNTLLPQGFSIRPKKSDITPNSPFLGYSSVLIKVTANNEKRIALYQNGFYFLGQKYVRYKRSASGARENKCLFILEALYDEMTSWSSCGINEATIPVSDLTSWEAYRALTLSGIEALFKLPKKAILILKDQHSNFITKAMAVTADDTPQPDSIGLTASAGKVKITNCIWDGEALLDESVFEDIPGYENKSMLLLRNRFFKTCAFRTKLQKWFKDNDVKFSELNGYTTARNVEDIKIVITESSLKYLKFSANHSINDLKDWLEHFPGHSLSFGIVKTDHSTSFMNGEMVQTNYQLLNTLGLTKKQTEDLLRPSIEYLQNIIKDPVYFMHYINYNYDNADTFLEDLLENEPYEDNEESTVNDIPMSIYTNYQRKVVTDMLALTDDFARCSIYNRYKYSQAYAFRNKLRSGHILVTGTYATLFGNGAELLYATTHKKYIANEKLYNNKGEEIEVLHANEIYSPRFKNGEELCCARSPHITMGNLFLGKNKVINIYQEYFSLSNEIICVNAINENIMQRLNGADYDSDSMLITNNKIIVDAIKPLYNLFLVPVNMIEQKNKSNDTLCIHDFQGYAMQLAQIDSAIAINNVGKITNLSQRFNSFFWTRYPAESITPSLYIEALGFYEELCILAVLSNVEVDKAKRTYQCNIKDALKELHILEKIYRLHMISDGNGFRIEQIPRYHRYLTKNKAEIKTKEKLYSLVYDTIPSSETCPMAYIYEIVTKKILDAEFYSNTPSSKETECTYRNLISMEKFVESGNDSRDKAAIEKIVQTAAIEIKRLYKFQKSANDFHYLKAKIIKDCFDQAAKKIRNEHIISLLLKDIDNGQIDNYRSLLFAAICYDPKQLFYKMVKKAHPSYMPQQLVRDIESGDKMIYGIPHKIADMQDIHISISSSCT